MWCECDNTNCKLNINRIEGKLINTLTLKDDSGHSKTCSKPVTSKAFAGLEAGG